MKPESKIPFLRSRVKRCGTVVYSLELPGDPFRREVPLGTSLDEALAHRAVHLFKHHHCAADKVASPIKVLDLYLLIKVPLLAPRSIKENTASIQKLLLFFEQTSTLRIARDGLEVQYKKWRDPRLTLRAAREFGLLMKIFNWYDEMLNAHAQTAHDQ